MLEGRLLSKNLSVLGIIPARYASVRFPGKPLADIEGRPMIEWVYRAARRALSNAVVATDDRRIYDAVARFGGTAIMTPRTLASGTDRMAYVARRLRADTYVNIQGDEPLLNPGAIRQALRLSGKTKSIATVAVPLDPKAAHDPNVVKVVVGAGSRALYFSRAFIPFPRDGGAAARPLKHLGLYVYPRAELLKFVALPSPSLEKTEKLEQLRALYHGLPIYVAVGNFDSIGVDTFNDLLKVRREMKKRFRKYNKGISK